MLHMSTKNLSQPKIFALSNETTKVCWQLGSLSKSDKHFKFWIFLQYATNYFQILDAGFSC